MGIFKRLEDIVSSNLNDLLDRNENPEPMLRQAIREMEVAIEEATKTTAKAMAQETLLRSQLSEAKRESLAWQLKAEKSIAADEDDKARQALGRRREQEKIAAALEDQLAACEVAAKTLRHQLEGMQARLSEAKRMMGVVAARHKVATVRQQEFSTNVKTNAFDRFEKITEKVAMAEAEADAMRELSGRPKREDFDLEPASEIDDVEEELVALKKKLQ